MFEQQSADGGEIESTGAPVFDASGAAIAAISVAGPSYYFAEQPQQKPGIAAAVMATAARLSQLLGYTATDPQI